jgi:hypothetical protein
MPRDYATDAALRPQPKRDGPDHWSTPDCLAAALVTHIPPFLPRAPIGEPAAGDGALVRAIEATGHRVFPTGLCTLSREARRTPHPTSVKACRRSLNGHDALIVS